MVFLVITGLMYLFVFLEPENTAEEGERDIRIPRAPAQASNVENPLPSSPLIVSEGEKIFKGKGTCYTCHGITGKGDGPAGLELKPRPRDFTNSEFQKLRTDGELFWVIRHGSPGTRMFSYSPAIITEDEAWRVIHYLRTLGDGSPGVES